MALAPVNAQVQPLPRSELASFLKNQRQIDAFERLQLDNDTIVSTINELVRVAGEMIEAPVVTYGPVSVFTNDRIVAAGYGINLTVGPSTAAISLTTTGVSPGPYGGPSTIPTFTVDDRGRILSAGGETLNSDNVTEGGANLFYTDARARQAISAGDGLSYDSMTGEMAVAPAGTYDAPTGTVSRATFATYTAPVISNPPTQAEVQALADGLQAVSRTLAALITDLKANSNLS